MTRNAVSMDVEISVPNPGQFDIFSNVSLFLNSE